MKFINRLALNSTRVIYGSVALSVVTFFAGHAVMAHHHVPIEGMAILYLALLLIFIAGAAVMKRSQRTNAELNAAHNIIDRIMREQWVFLAETDKEFSSSIDFSQTLVNVSRIGVPAFADYCAVFLKEADGSYRLRQEYPPQGLSAACPEAGLDISLASRFEKIETSELLTEPSSPFLAEFGLNTPRHTSLRERGIHSILVTPLRTRGMNMGALVFARIGESPLHLNSSLSEQFAQRASLALESARLYQDAQRAAQLQEEIVAIVSHDIKNPLSVIQLQAELINKLLQGEPLSPARIKKAAEHIQLSADQLKRLVNNLLEVARLEALAQPPKKEPFAINLLLQDVVFALKPLAMEKSIELRAELPDIETILTANRESIFQVMMNLACNALKFAPNGGEVQIRMLLQQGTLRIDVADNGPGIMPEHLPHVFDRFWQATHQRRAGAGLGLAIAKNIIEAHKGRIWAESDPGKGSVFSFTLPRSG